MMGFCNENGYPYLSIYRRIKTLESNGNEDNLVEEAIKKYEERLHIDKINSIFSSLDKNVNIEDICKYLKINYDNVLDLIDMSFTIKQAINMIWYFSDRQDEYGNKIITDKKIKELFILIDDIKRNENVEELNYYDLLGIYKSALYDTRDKIVERQIK